MSNVLPKGWNINQIGNILDISTGNKDTQNKIEYGKYPFFVRSNTIERLDSYSFDGEAVLTAGDGVGVGKVFHYYNGKFAFHQRVYAIYGFNEEIDGKYFYRYFSDNFLKEVEKYSAKTSVDSVRLKMISNMDILLPPKKEQQKIAEILSEVDDAISKIEELFEKNKRLKTALMQDLLTYGIDENGKVRNPQTHKFKPSELGDIPEEWDYISFIEFLDVIDGDRGDNYPTEADFYKDEFCLFLNAKNVTKNGFNFEEKSFITKEKDKKLSKGKLEINDLILTTRGTVGNVAYFDQAIKIIHMRINSGMVILRIFSSQLHHKYFYEFLKSYIFEKQKNNVIFGSAQPQLTVAQIKKFYCCFPKSKTEQQKIAQILSSQDEKIEDIKNKLNKLKSLKVSLMQDLLSGKVRVTKLMEANS